MRGWNSISVHDAPVGALSLLAICITAMCFSVVGLLNRWIAGALLVFCGFSFSPAIICCVYSVAKETSKVFGLAGLAIAVVVVLLQRDTLYFVEMGLGLVPITLIVMMIVAKRRARRREEQAAG